MPGIEGHKFNPDAIDYALDHFVDPAIARDHRDWTPEQVRQEGRHQMAISLWESHGYYTQERQRMPEIEKRWEFVETSPGVHELQTKWGEQTRTLREMWQNTEQAANDVSNPKTYNPDAYNAEEARAQFAMQDALVSGRAAAAAIMVSDPAGFRYAQIWERKPDGRFSAKVIDVGLVTEKDLSREDAGLLLGHVKNLYGKTHKTVEAPTSYPLMLLREGNINPGDIKTVARSFTVFSASQGAQANKTPRTFREGTVTEKITDTAWYATRQTWHETRRTIQDSVPFLYDKKRREEARQRLSELAAAQGIRQLFGVQRGENKKKKKENGHHVSERLTIKRIQEKSENLWQIVSSRYAEMIGAKKMLRFITVAGVGIGTVPFFLHVFTKELPRSVKAVEKNIGRQEKKKRKMRNFELRKMRRLRKEVRRHAEVSAKKKEKRHKRKKQQMFSTSSEVQLAIEKRKKKKRNRKRVKSAEKLHGEYKRRKTVRKEKSILQPREVIEKKLWKVLRRLAKRMEKREKRRTKKHELRRKERRGPAPERKTHAPSESKTIVAYTFALVLWRLFYCSEFHVSKKVLFYAPNADASSRQGEAELTIAEGKKESSSEALVVNESPQWILLAIIWYLAMICEQRRVYGQTQYVLSSKKKKTKPVRQSFFPYQQWPASGVVYQFA